jgi:hypothetical protein
MEANKVGRPLLYETPEKLSEAIEGYFASTDRATLSGLAFHLGIDRKTLYNYSDRDEFFYIVKRARDRVEMVYEERLIYDNSPTGVIFALKNMDWRDRTETDHTTKGDKITGSPFVIGGGEGPPADEL